MAEHTDQRRMMRALGVSLAFTLVLLAVSLVGLMRARERPWDPLGEYPIQRVDSKIPGYDTPSAFLSSGEIIVTGTKCANQATQVTGRVSWVEVAPGGMIVALPVGSTNRTKGCTTQTFRNDFPADVVARVERLASRGVFMSVWQVTGYETPIRADHPSDGVKHPWQSQNFTIVYDGTKGKP